MLEYFINSQRQSLGSGPGPRTIIYGNTTFGYFGELAAADIATTTEISTIVNFTAGSVQHPDPGWIKVISNGKVLFIAKHAIRQSWAGVNIYKTDLVNAHLVYGDKIVNINGYNYKIRLLTGGNADPATAGGGEYNSVIYPIMKGSPTAASWAPYNPTDIGIATGNEGIVCQETYGGYLLYRGRNTMTDIVSIQYANWRPVLELIA